MIGFRLRSESSSPRYKREKVQLSTVYGVTHDEKKDDSIVIAFDEKSGIEAVERTTGSEDKKK